MSLDKFISDVKHGSPVEPLVTFLSASYTNPLYIGTSNYNIDTQKVYGNLESVSSIKESIDIENRKYKIGSVTLSLNNNRIGSTRLLNRIYNDSNLRVNSVCIISYKTKQSNHPVFLGRIRKIENTLDRITMTIEDSTQQDAHKELPSERTSESENLIEKYRNKPIPMVYGDVKKSPCLLEVYENDFLLSYAKIIFDYEDLNIDNEYIVSNTINVSDTLLRNTHIYIGEQGTYLPIGVSSDYNELNSSNNNFEELTNSTHILFRQESINQSGILGDEIVVSHILRVPEKVSAIKQHSNYYSDDDANSGWWYTDTSQSSLIGSDSSNVSSNILLRARTNPIGIVQGLEGETDDAFLHKVTNSDGVSGPDGIGISDVVSIKCVFNEINFSFTSETYLLTNFLISIAESNSAMISLCNSLEGRSVISNTLISESPNLLAHWIVSDGDEILFNNISGEGQLSNIDSIPIEKWSNVSSFKEVFFGLNRFYSSWSNVGTLVPPLGTNVFINKFILSSSLNLYQKIYIDKALDRKYYADLKGRTSAYNDDGITTPELIITDIIQNELNLTTDASLINFDFSNPENGEHGTTTSAAPIKWRYAFTQDKEINSKKLVEEIASYTQLFPYFKDGGFKINTIKKFYEPYQEITDSKYIINPIKIKDYSFSRTEVRNLYTDIEFHYDYDFSSNSYKKVYTKTAQELFPNYDASVIGVEQRTLKKECRFIYDDLTAEGVANLLIALQCTQHNYINLTLSLEYIYFKVGDLVRFPDNSLLNGEMMYGENYTLEKYNVEGVGQTKYNLWKITNIDINNSNLKIKLYQLHNLESEVPVVLGCMDSNAENYDPDATINDGSCTYADPNIEIEGCTDPNALNYNPDANVDDGTCEFALPNANDFFDVTNNPDLISINGSYLENNSDLELFDNLEISFSIPEFCDSIELNVGHSEGGSFVVQQTNTTGIFNISLTNDPLQHNNSTILYVPPGANLDENNTFQLSVLARGIQTQTDSVVFWNDPDNNYQVVETLTTNISQFNYNVGLEIQDTIEDYIKIEKGTIDVERIDGEIDAYNRIKYTIKIYVSGEYMANFRDYFDSNLPPLYLDSNPDIEEYSGEDNFSGIRAKSRMTFKEIALSTNETNYPNYNGSFINYLLLKPEFVSSEYEWSAEFQKYVQVYTYKIEKVHSCYEQIIGAGSNIFEIKAYRDLYENNTIFPPVNTSYALKENDNIPFHLEGTFLDNPSTDFFQYTASNGNIIFNSLSQIKAARSAIIYADLEIKINYTLFDQEFSFTDFELINWQSPLNSYSSFIKSGQSEYINTNNYYSPYLNEGYLSTYDRIFNFNDISAINVADFLRIAGYTSSLETISQLSSQEYYTAQDLPTLSYLVDNNLITDGSYTHFINYIIQEDYNFQGYRQKIFYFMIISEMLKESGITDDSDILPNSQININKIQDLNDYLLELVLQ